MTAEAPIVNGNAVVAKQRALADAFRQTVERAFSDLLKESGNEAQPLSAGLAQLKASFANRGQRFVRSYRILASSMHLTSSVERMVIPPFGLHGGEPGATCRVSLTRNGEAVAIDGKSNLVLQQDDLVTIEMCGGGGFGAAA